MEVSHYGADVYVALPNDGTSRTTAKVLSNRGPVPSNKLIMK